MIARVSNFRSEVPKLGSSRLVSVRSLSRDDPSSLHCVVFFTRIFTLIVIVIIIIIIMMMINNNSLWMVEILDFSISLFHTYLLVINIIIIYYIDKSVLVEDWPLLKFIRNYIRDSSGVFSISSLVRIAMTSFPAFTLFFGKNTLVYMIKRKLHGCLKIWFFIFSW